MKHILLAVLLLLAFSNLAQNFNGQGIVLQEKQQQGDYNRDLPDCLFCDELAIFSNSPDINSGGGISDDQRCYTSYDNFYGLTQPFDKVVFWGYDITFSDGYTACTPSEEKDFEIVFYENNSGNVGLPVASYLVTPSKEFCTTSNIYSNAPVYRYEVLLNAPVSLSEGWVSVRAVGGTDNCWFTWLVATADDQLLWQDCGSEMSSYELDFAFCLYSAEITGTTIPISNWAVGLAIFLIVAIVVFRFRKQF